MDRISISDICVDQNTFTIEDARNAAEQVFALQEDDFRKIKNEKWYQRFIKAITFGAGDRKLIINDIRSISQLQTLFLQIYAEHYSGLDAQLRDIIENQAKTNRIVSKLYYSCVEKIRPQEKLTAISEHDKQILLLLLAQYQSLNGHEDEFKMYRASIAKACAVSLPQGKFEAEQLSRVSAVKVLYRCILELCAIDDGIDSFSMPNDIYEAIDNLNISQAAKRQVENAVHREIDTFGSGYLLDKYSIAKSNINIDDLELTEMKASNDQAENALPVEVGQAKEAVSNTAAEIVSSTDAAFLMTVDDIFKISGRGTVASGIIEQGRISVMDEVEIVAQERNYHRRTVVSGIEYNHKLCDSAEQGMNVGLLLRGIAKKEVKRGYIITKPMSTT